MGEVRADPCRLGRVEYDGFRYCFAHGEFVHEYSDRPGYCDGWRRGEH